MTLYKRITLGVIALAAIVLVVGVLAVSHLELRQHKERIEQLVLEKTGRQLQINGSVNLQVFPWPGLSVQDVIMGNAAEFTDAEFATVQSSEFQVEVLPLLVGDIKIKSVSLQGLSLKLQRDTDGKTNWDDLMATTAVVATETDSDVVQEVEAGAPVIAALSAGGVKVSDANVSYVDERDASYITLNELNLSTGSVVLSEPFAFESDFALTNSAGSGTRSEVSANGEIALDLANNIYQLQRLKVSTVNSGSTLPIDPLAISFNGELVADLNAQTVDIEVSDGMLSGVPVSGEFHAVGLQENARLFGMLNSGEFDASSVIQQHSPTASALIAPELFKRSSVSARFERSEDALLIQDVKVSVSDVEVTGDFQIANLSNSGVLSGQLQSNSFDPTPWVDSIGLAMPGANVMRTAQVSAAVRQSGQLLAFNQLEIQLDESMISGDIELSDINADNPPITYALFVDKIDIDRYLGADSQIDSNGVSTNGARTNSARTNSARTNSVRTNSVKAQALQADEDKAAQLIPVDWLRKLDLEGEIVFEQVSLAGMQAQNAVVPVMAREGRIEIKEAKADMYAGSFFSTISLDVQSDEPLLTATGNLNGLKAEPLLQDALSKGALLTGIANLSVDVLSRGSQWSQLIEGANGALSLRITDGFLSGIDIASELRRAGRLLSIGDSSQDPVSQDLDKVALQSVLSVTDFSELSLSAVIADGVLQSDDLVFNSPNLQLSGEGGVNLGSRMMDYLLHVMVTDSAELEDDETLQRLAGVELTLPVRGPYDDLSEDLTRLLANAFESDLINEIKLRIDDWPTSSQAGASQEQEREVEALIESEKEALRLRLEKEQEAATVAREKKQKLALSEEERLQQLEIDKEALKEKLHNNLKKSLGELLDEN